MLKKLISVLLCLCLLCGFITVTSAATSTKADKYQIIDILKHLNMLGDDYDSDTIDWDKPITRAEFAFYAASILKRDYTGTQLHFHDVSKQHWAFSGISALVESGLLDVNEEKKFHPDNIITVDDAVSVVLKAIGYRFGANEGIGLTPIKIAGNFGITKGVSLTGEMTFSDVIQLLYNTLITNTMELTSTSGGFGYGASNKTYLESEYYLSYKEGILEGFDGISVNGKAVRDNSALISGIEYEIKNIDLSDFIGCQIAYIYDFTNYDNTGIILWAEKVSSEDLTLYYGENDIEFDSLSYKMSYYDLNKRKKSVQISKTADVVYNDEYITSGIESLLEGKTYSIFDGAVIDNMYSVKLIKNSGDAEYSKVILSSYQNIIIGAKDIENQGIYDKITKEYISFNNTDKFNIVNTNKQKINFSDLKLGDVLSIYKSISGSRVKIIVSDNTVSGQIVSKKYEDEYDYITIEGIEYRGSEKGIYWNESINLAVVLYLDANNLIAFVERDRQNGNVAYLIDARYRKKEDKLKLKLFRTDGIVSDVECADIIRIDNVKYKNAESAYDAIGGTDVISSLILYKTNSDGLITHIYFPSTSKTAELKLLQNNITATYRGSGRLGRKSFLNDDTIIFQIPKNPKDADYEDFGIISKSGMMADSSYTYSTYTTFDEIGYEDILVLNKYEQKELARNGLLVTKKYRCLNEYDEPVDAVEGYKGSEYVSLKCDSYCSLASVNLGNYITYAVNGNGYISKVTVRCDYPGGIRPLQTDLNQGKTFSSGYVNDVVGVIARIGDASGADFDTVYNFTSSIPVLVYNTTQNEARIGSVANLKPYKLAGSGCSYVFTHVVNGASIVYVVYE